MPILIPVLIIFINILHTESDQLVYGQPEET